MRYGFGHRAKLPSPDLCHITGMLEDIKGLKRGESIEVVWLDACIARGRNPDSLKNRDFATYKREVGYFCDLVTDHRYNQYHLIIAVGGVKDDIMSIPLTIVMSVKQYEGKKGQLAMKGQRASTRTMGWSDVKRLDGRGYKIIIGPEEKRADG